MARGAATSGPPRLNESDHHEPSMFREAGAGLMLADRLAIRVGRYMSLSRLTLYWQTCFASQ